MRKEIAKRWAKALRSGKYNQTTGQLKSQGNQFCCLGVLCDIAPKRLGRWDGTRFFTANGLSEWSGLPASVLKWAGMTRSTSDPQSDASDADTSRGKFIKLNDTLKLSFADIAAIIEKEYETI